MVGGRIRGMSAPVTKKPSFTSSRRSTTLTSSRFRPTKKVTASTGTKYRAPSTQQETRLAGS
jgi:hypothetical protein